MNWVINIGILCLITASYVANREGEYFWERRFAGILVVAMVITVFYGVLKLQADADDTTTRIARRRLRSNASRRSGRGHP